MTTATLDRPLTKADRCDACSAQALVRVTLANGELTFCGHHWKIHGDSVRPLATDVYAQPVG